MFPIIAYESSNIKYDYDCGYIFLNILNNFSIKLFKIFACLCSSDSKSNFIPFLISPILIWHTF